MTPIPYTGLYKGKQVQMTITDMSKEFNRSRDFIRRHTKTALDRGEKDIIAYVCMKSNTLRRNVGKSKGFEDGRTEHKPKRINSKGIKSRIEDKFYRENKEYFNRFLYPKSVNL